MNEEVKAQAVAWLKNLSLKKKIFGGYALIGLLVTLYYTFFGPLAYKGFFYNLGHYGLFWPTLIFPSLKGTIQVLVILGMIAVAFLLG